jgi:hypothetical protein
MKARELFLLAVGLAACAAAETRSNEVEDPPHVPVSVPDLGSVADASTDVEDAGCNADCEYFPVACTDDVLCPSGPFEPATGVGFDPRTQINVIRGRSASDVWVAGAMGALAHFDGTSWVRSDPGQTETMRALWLGDFGELAFGMLDRLYTHDQAGWSPNFLVGSDISYRSRFVSAWSTPGSTSLWCATVSKELGEGEVTGLWRLDHSQEGFALRAGVVNDVCKAAGCTQMLALHGVSADELWAVGMGGSIVRIADADKETPRVESFNSQTWNSLYGVWAATTSEAWAVGAMGTIRHYGGSTLWEVVPNVPTEARLNAVWGTSPSDVWAVGDGAVVLHYDGKSWSRAKIGSLGKRRPNLTAVWGVTPGHVWIGGEGVVLSLGGKP